MKSILVFILLLMLPILVFSQVNDVLKDLEIENIHLGDISNTQEEDIQLDNPIFKSAKLFITDGSVDNIRLYFKNKNTLKKSTFKILNILKNRFGEPYEINAFDKGESYYFMNGNEYVRANMMYGSLYEVAWISLGQFDVEVEREYDEFTKTETIAVRGGYETLYSLDGQKFSIALKIASSSKGDNLYMVIQKKEGDFNFFSSIIFLIDGETYTLKVDSRKDVLTGKAIETAAIYIDDNLLDNILTGQIVKFRVVGKYNADFDFGIPQKNALKKLIEVK